MNSRGTPSAWLVAGLCASSFLAARADWPMLRGEPTHAGFLATQLKPPFRLAWAVELEGDRLGTAMEPILAGGRLFVATHQGNLYALDAASGNPLWRFKAASPFLHSPAVAQTKARASVVVAGDAHGRLFGLDAVTGKPAWQLDSGGGGFSAAPIISEGTVHIGTRGGDLLAVSLANGKLRWRRHLGAPIRQTAALHDGRVFVTGEDLRVRSFSAADGKELWSSEQLPGQTARDYYPIVVKSGSRTFVIVRTNPALSMGQRIGRDRTLLCRSAGVDDSSWKTVDAWIKSPQARGSPELWDREQDAIASYLSTNRDARSFFVLDAETGRETAPAPVLWIAGCQAVGSPPALTADGRLLVFYRSAYGNWNHGVAPLVALGLLNLDNGKISPLLHQQGAQPAWNCFWGTADESQSFLVAGETALLTHQGTLSGLDLQQNKLFPIWGERDTYGGFKNPPWARNEWHGPARAGLAISNGRLYWQTGSRLLCLEPGAPGRREDRPKPTTVAGFKPVATAPSPPPSSPRLLRRELRRIVEEVLSQRWAPLFCEPGLAGRTFAFDHSGEFFEAMAWAWPHLDSDLRKKVSAALRSEWEQHPPFTGKAWYPLNQGAGREFFTVPAEYRARLGGDKPPHPFGNLHAVWFYARRCNEQDWVLRNWNALKSAHEDFRKSGWQLDSTKGDPFANRYLASMLAFADLAERAGDPDAARQARQAASETTAALVSWWTAAARKGTLTVFNTSAELDPFIGKGDGISLAIAPHRHKLALFQDLTPTLGKLLAERCPDAARQVWLAFETLCPTWYLLGEERQVHFGENFLDPPDFALSAFRAAAWLSHMEENDLARRVDQPFSRADLYHLIKLAVALERKAN